MDPGRGYALDVHDGGVASRKRTMPPLTLPIPASCDARQPAAAQMGAYLPMTISPGGGVRQPAATDAGYLPMFYSPGSGDTPDGPITSPSELTCELCFFVYQLEALSNLAIGDTRAILLM